MNRQAIEDRIEALKRERGAAKLDGRKFDGSAIETLETELAALNDADGERARRDRAAAQAEVEEERAKLRSQLATIEQDRLAAIADAEKAARALSESIGRVIEFSGEMAATLHRLTGTVPMELHVPAIENRLASRLSAVMRTTKGRSRYRIGHLDWLASHFSPETDWREAEQALLEKYLENIKGH